MMKKAPHMERRTLASTTSPKKTTMRLHKTIGSNDSGGVFLTRERLKRTTRMNEDITKYTERLLRESKDSKVGEGALMKY
jgi:hypothetical protein